MEAKHPKNPDLGERDLSFAKSVWVKGADLLLLTPETMEVTLMHWGNCIIKKIEKGKDGKVTKATGELNPNGDVKSTKWKLHWVANVENTTPVVLRRYDTVLTKEKLEEDDDIKDCINWNSQRDSLATGDPMLKTLQSGDMLMLERTGYFKVDQVPARAGEQLVLVEIPCPKIKKKKMATLQKQAQLLLTSGDWGNAVRSFDEAIPFYKAAHRWVEVGQMLYRQGYCYYKNGSMDDAVRRFDQAMAMAAKQLDFAEISKCQRAKDLALAGRDKAERARALAVRFDIFNDGQADQNALVPKTETQTIACLEKANADLLAENKLLKMRYHILRLIVTDQAKANPFKLNQAMEWDWPVSIQAEGWLHRTLIVMLKKTHPETTYETTGRVVDQTRNFDGSTQTETTCEVVLSTDPRIKKLKKTKSKQLGKASLKTPANVPFAMYEKAAIEGM
jgi:tetratricopeptide (TPR) repeat protein